MTTERRPGPPPTSIRSARVRSVRALGRRSARDRAGLFVAEGPQSVREAVTFAPDSVAELYVTAAATQRHADLLRAAAHAGVVPQQVGDDVLAAMGDTEHPQGLLAVCRAIDVPLQEALPGDAQLVVVLTNVRDPGNAGTVIRCADAAGADAVLVSGASVDVYNPKVVRSTAGSLWHLPIHRGSDVPTILAHCRDRGLTLLAADGVGDTLLPDVDLAGPHAWVMGNEAWGLDEADRELCDEVVRVPIYGQAESLNLAMAAAVCLYTSAAAQRS